MIISPAVRRPSRFGSYLTVGRALLTNVPDLAARRRKPGAASRVGRYWRRTALAPQAAASFRW